jgi:hypothetical protein
MRLCELYEFIPKRKSVREFSDESLSEELLEEFVDFLSEQEAPKDDVDWDFDILSEAEMFVMTEGEVSLKAPHYLVLRSEEKPFRTQNIGYLGELSALWFCAKGVGSCWLGGIRIVEDYEGLMPYVISIALGKTNSLYRGEDEVPERIPIKKLCRGKFEGDKLVIAEAVRLAPSSLNRQPTRLLAEPNDVIDVFRKTSYVNLDTDTLLGIDSGIAIAHIKVASESLGYNMEIQEKTPPPIWAGRTHTVSLHISPIQEDAE